LILGERPPCTQNTSSPTIADSAVQLPQLEADEVSGAMKSNVALLTEREDKSSDLHDMSGYLSDTADLFRQQARTLRWGRKWEKHRCVLIPCVLLLFASLLYVFRHNLSSYFVATSLALTMLFSATIVTAWRCLRRSMQASELKPAPRDDSWLPPFDEEIGLHPHSLSG